MINRGDYLKVKQAYKKKLATFGQNFFLLIFFLTLLVIFSCLKKQIPTFFGFLRNCSSNFKRNLKEIWTKGNNSEKKPTIFQKFEKTVFRQSHEECFAKVSKLGVEWCGYIRKYIHRYIEIHAYMHTNILPNLGNT